MSSVYRYPLPEEDKPLVLIRSNLPLGKRYTCTSQRAKVGPLEEETKKNLSDTTSLGDSVVPYSDEESIGKLTLISAPYITFILHLFTKGFQEKSSRNTSSNTILVQPYLNTLCNFPFKHDGTNKCMRRGPFNLKTQRLLRTSHYWIALIIN